MVKVAGIDPGTESWDLVTMKDGEIIDEASIETKKVVADSSVLLTELKKLIGDTDLIVAPSGLGLPIKKVDQLTNADIAELTLKRPGEPVVVGLGIALELIRKLGLPAVVIPGVKHLPTVPEHRKVNKIDMGTADKVCAAAATIYDQANRFKIPYNETSLILIEMGRGFNAVLTIVDGQIVDGVGGALGAMGMRARGALDAEIAYSLGEIDKRVIYSGGASYIAGYPSAGGKDLAEMASKGDKLAKMALDAMMEGIVREVGGTLAATDCSVREILLSGAISRIEMIFKSLVQRLGKFASVRLVEKKTKTASEAAEGAAIIADGLIGGMYKDLVQNMGIREAGGSVYDHVYIKKF